MEGGTTRTDSLSDLESVEVFHYDRLGTGLQSWPVSVVSEEERLLWEGDPEEALMVLGQSVSALHRIQSSPLNIAKFALFHQDGSVVQDSELLMRGKYVLKYIKGRDGNENVPPNLAAPGSHADHARKRDRAETPSLDVISSPCATCNEYPKEKSDIEWINSLFIREQKVKPRKVLGLDLHVFEDLYCVIADGKLGLMKNHDAKPQKIVTRVSFSEKDNGGHVLLIVEGLTEAQARRIGEAKVGARFEEDLCLVRACCFDWFLHAFWVVGRNGEIAGEFAESKKGETSKWKQYKHLLYCFDMYQRSEGLKAVVEALESMPDTNIVKKLKEMFADMMYIIPMLDDEEAIPVGCCGLLVNAENGLRITRRSDSKYKVVGAVVITGPGARLKPHTVGNPGYVCQSAKVGAVFMGLADVRTSEEHVEPGDALYFDAADGFAKKNGSQQYYIGRACGTIIEGKVEVLVWPTCGIIMEEVKKGLEMEQRKIQTEMRALTKDVATLDQRLNATVKCVLAVSAYCKESFHEMGSCDENAQHHRRRLMERLDEARNLLVDTIDESIVACGRTEESVSYLERNRPSREDYSDEKSFLLEEKEWLTRKEEAQNAFAQTYKVHVETLSIFSKVHGGICNMYNMVKDFCVQLLRSTVKIIRSTAEKVINWIYQLFPLVKKVFTGEENSLN